MSSVLKAENAKLPWEQRRAGKRVQWSPHCGRREAARNLRRLQRQVLREQLAHCEWVGVEERKKLVDGNR